MLVYLEGPFTYLTLNIIALGNPKPPFKLTQP